MRPTCRAALVLLFLPALLGLAGPARGGDKEGPQRTPKLREVVDIPEDFVGREFTYAVRITPNQHWMQRASTGEFFIFVQDQEGSRFPSQGFSPGATINSVRFILPKEEGRTLIDRLNAIQMYEVRIRFRVDRVRDTITGNWLYLARISAVELP